MRNEKSHTFKSCHEAEEGKPVTNTAQSNVDKLDRMISNL